MPPSRSSSSSTATGVYFRTDNKPKLATDFWHSAGLSEDDAKGLLGNIIGWTVQSLADGAGAFVTRKLCSALVTYFMHFSHLWPSCVRHVLYCLDIGRGTSVEGLDDALGADLLASRLDRPKLRVATWFATSFVEEVGKTDMSAAK